MAPLWPKSFHAVQPWAQTSDPLGQRVSITGASTELQNICSPCCSRIFVNTLCGVVRCYLADTVSKVDNCPPMQHLLFIRVMTEVGYEPLLVHMCLHHKWSVSFSLELAGQVSYVLLTCPFCFVFVFKTGSNFCSIYIHYRHRNGENGYMVDQILGNDRFGKALDLK